MTEHKDWDQARIEQYILDGTEESLTLDYKDARSLAKTDSKRLEISKDVSAMANSAGGIIIYGVAAYGDKARKHLPEKIDPVERTQFSKEWLDQVINSNIHPRIDGVIIHPVAISTAQNHVVYVVEIPQSHTAHQAATKKYHKRFNFESVPMEDYEIRDVMGRGKYPRMEVEFEIEIDQEVLRDSHVLPTWGSTPNPPQIVDRVDLIMSAFNTGKVFAHYVNAFIEIPDILLPMLSDDDLAFEERDTFTKDGVVYCRHYKDNTRRDVVDGELGLYGWTPKYGPARYDPVLPGRHHPWDSVRLRSDFENVSLDGLFIEWEVSADNAPVRTGKIAVQDIKVTDKRSKAE